MTALTALRERLARDHMNHGCDTWDEHMRDCEALLEVAEALERIADGKYGTRERSEHFKAYGVPEPGHVADAVYVEHRTAREVAREALARLTQEGA